MYDPSVGRWLEEDPDGFGAGDANLYRYVENDPTNAVDPSGLIFSLVYAIWYDPVTGKLRGRPPDGSKAWWWEKEFKTPGEQIDGTIDTIERLAQSGWIVKPVKIKLTSKDEGFVVKMQNVGVKEVYIDSITLSGKDVPPGVAEGAKNWFEKRSTAAVLKELTALDDLIRTAQRFAKKEPTGIRDILDLFNGNTSLDRSSIPEGYVEDADSRVTRKVEKDAPLLHSRNIVILELDKFRYKVPGLDVEIEVSGKIIAFADDVEFARVKKRP